MNKTGKNLLVAFTFLCAIALIVFTFELFRINGDAAGSDDSGAAASEQTADESDESPNVQPPESPSSNGSAPVNTEDPPDNSPIVMAGTRYELLYSNTHMLVVYVDDELFEHNPEMEMADEFKFAEDETSSLMIHFTQLQFGAVRAAEDILVNYLDGSESTVGGMGPIRRSPLTGVFVSGVNEDETFEAWIHTISNDDGDADDIGMAFIIRYRTDEQKNALYAILNTLVLEPI